MAKLSPNEIIERIKSPKQGTEIQSARRKKSRNNLHTQPITDATGVLKNRAGHREFLAWVKQLLGEDQNYARYEALYRPPVPTNELSESIFSHFQKIFFARDSFLKFNFENPELEQDFNEYRNQINDWQFMKEDGFEAFKASIDSFVVISLPSLEKDEEGNVINGDGLPEPFPHMVDIDHVIDAGVSKSIYKSKGDNLTRYSFNVEYLIFWDTPEKVVALDEVNYYTFSYDGSGTYTLTGTFPHGLSYTPAKSFWTTPLNNHSKIQKLGRIDGGLSDLDWVLFWKYAKKYLDTYGAFPIYVTYKKKCNYKDPSGNRCNNGMILYSEPGEDATKEKKCPSCSNPVAPGPGSVHEVDAPQDRDDADLMANPLKIISVDKDSLEYVTNEENRLEVKIFENAVGKGGEPINNQAVNKTQIEAQFESRAAVMLNTKGNFERTHFFILDTIARIRYGENYIGGTVNYGTEFFLKDSMSQEEDYSSGKKNGMPMHDLAVRREMIYHTRYKNNPDKLQRAKILSQLEPYPDMTIQEVSILRKDAPDVISSEDLRLKAKFNNLIDRFEREQTNILMFGNALEMSKRVDLIKGTLLEYLKEDVQLVLPVEGGDPALTIDPDPEDINTPIDVEAEAKAKLKGSVGGVQGILEIQKSVAAGTTNYDAALTLLNEIFGFEKEIGMQLLGPRKAITKPQPIA